MGITIITRLYCILSIVGEGVINYSLATLIYSIHVLLMALYLFMSLYQRILTLEATSVQAMCLDVLDSTKLQRAEYNKLLRHEQVHYDTKPLKTRHWIYHKFKRHYYLM